MNITVKINGVEEFMKDVEKVKSATDSSMTEILTDMALITHQEAITGIKSGPTTGRLYQKYAPKRTHRASAPGEYPAHDTGVLASSIKLDLPKKGKYISRVWSSEPRAVALEFGTTKMARRPWLSRSANTMLKNIASNIKTTVAKYFK